MKMKIKSYEDLTLEKWQALRSIDWNEDIDDVERQAGIIGVLCDLSVEEVMKMPLAEYKECAMEAEFLKETPRVRRISAVRGLEVGDFSLYAPASFKDITVAQYVDFQELAGEEGKEAELLSVFLIPKGCEYCEGYDIAAVQDAIRRNVSVQMFVDLSAFFLTKLLRLTADSLAFSEETVARMKEGENKARMQAKIQRAKTFMEALTGNGDGLR